MKFFYSCSHCENSFSLIDPSSGNDYSEEVLEKNKEAPCPKCGSKVSMRDYLPKRGFMIYREKIASGKFRGKFLTKLC